MRFREFLRRVKVFNEREERRAKERQEDFFNLLNGVGLATHQAIALAFEGKQWKWIEPQDKNAGLLPTLEMREAAMMKRLEDRRKRRAEQATIQADLIPEALRQ